jgi:outer membrane protein OmpA-like peptidoglycan-associated protein
MEGRFDWHEPAHVRGRESFLPAPDRVGWWMVISLSVAIVLHIILFISLGHLKMGFGWTSTEEITTQPVVVRPVEEELPVEIPPAETEIPTPEPDRTKLVDDVEILEQLKDPELEMKPEITEASFDVDLKIEAPALAGDPAGDKVDIASAVEIASEDLESLGKTETYTPVAAQGQMIVDPGSELAQKDPLDSFMKDLIKKGSAGKAADGKLDGTSSLDEIAGLPENVLVTKTTMLPGDLLFEYNSAELRSSSKVGMQKIALVMDLNPQLYCWIEGHTDLYGGDDFNYDLSLRRAESVKAFLVAMGMDPLKIRTRGLGKNHPIVAQGTQEEQSINRRVEIKMRKTPPPVDGIAPPSVPVIVPPRAQPVAPEPTPEPEPATPKATPIRVKPMRALPVEEEIPEPPKVAVPVVEEPAPPKAAPVEEESPPRAAPVREPAPPRAQPIEE